MDLASLVILMLQEGIQESEGATDNRNIDTEAHLQPRDFECCTKENTERHEEEDRRENRERKTKRDPQGLPYNDRTAEKGRNRDEEQESDDTDDEMTDESRAKIETIVPYLRLTVRPTREPRKKKSNSAEEQSDVDNFFFQFHAA